MYDFLVTTARGLDELLAGEIRQLCPHLSVKVKPGQVSFQGELADAYTLCLWSRLANRVLLLLAEGDCDSQEDLYRVAAGIQWSRHLNVEQTFAIDFVGTNNAINNSLFGALKIKDALVDHFNDLYEKRPSVDKLTPQIRIQGRLRRQHLGIYLDLSGQSLHLRHYRQRTGAAPLKEHMACAMLIRSGWAADMSKPLLDPMCGSGTVAIEAAMMAASVAPAANRREWGFTHWPGHQPELWQGIKIAAEKRRKTKVAPIFASDQDGKLLHQARENARRAGVASLITFTEADATKVMPAEGIEPGYLVSNPPYGERLGELTGLLPMFRTWGDHLKAAFTGWRVSLLTSNRDLLRQLKLVAAKEYQLFNGKLECQLVNYVLEQRNLEVRNDAPVANDFSNRLAKNVKRLKKWRNQANTNCYRVYDADLPEYNVAVDLYDDWVVVQEYAAPKDIPEAKAKRRLHDILIALPHVLGIHADHVVLKTRMQQKGASQYEKVAKKQVIKEVYENGAKLLVNLTDYLDTGLFLDHRTTRKMVQDSAKGKDVLNLFSYTGSVSVHAALGGARSVTTVDMSRTYLDWAKENFKLNNLKGPYEFIQADCLNWMPQQQANQFDLIFLDPPTFSNSKRMEGTWDVQRDHVKMLDAAVNCLRPGGQIYFSNNLRTFKLDEEAVAALGLKAQNISQATLPEDFARNPKIHHCWLLSYAG